MKKLDLDTGVQQYEIGKAVVEFNPTDGFFLERVNNALEKINGFQNKYEGQVNAIQAAQNDENELEATQKMFKVSREIDQDMRKVIDDLFNKEGVSYEIFGETSLFALAKNGLPVSINLLIAVGDEINDCIEEAKKAQDSEKMQEYLGKYKK
jgi:hypothetical protein